MLDRRKRVARQLGQIRGLEIPLPGNPVAPHMIERGLENAFELGRVIARTVGIAPQPLVDLVRPMDEREVREEARAVEIVVHPDLEIIGDALRFQRQRRVDRRIVADLRAERHLVVSTLAAPETARHPCLHEHGAAFQIPARGVDPRGREIIIEDCFGVRFDRHRLAVKEAAPSRIVLVPHIHCRDVGEFVIA